MNPNNLEQHEIKPLIKQTLLAQQPVRLKVTGHSMRPFLKHKRHSVTLTAITAPLKKNDIILYELQNQQFVLHRIINIGQPIICRGDALSRKESVNLAQILGVVTEIHHNDKPINMYSTPYKIKIKLWHLLYPFRRILLRLISR